MDKENENEEPEYIFNAEELAAANVFTKEYIQDFSPGTGSSDEGGHGTGGISNNKETLLDQGLTLNLVLMAKRVVSALIVQTRKKRKKVAQKLSHFNIFNKRSIASRFFFILKTVFTLYMAVIGLVGFSLFIMEESLQTAMFSTWAAKNAQDWALVLKSNVFFKKTNAAMLEMNQDFGWLNPFGYTAYKAFGSATNQMVLANEAQLANFETQLLALQKEKVSLHLTLTERRSEEGSEQLIFGKFCIIIQQKRDYYIPVVGETIFFHGIVSQQKLNNGKILLEADQVLKLVLDE